MKRKYTLKNGSILPIKANVAGREIERLKKINGELSPQLVLKSARPKNSVLHECFEWDNAKAAQKYRLQQASYLLRAIEIVYIGDDGEKTKPVRAFVALIEEGTYKPRSYKAIGEVMSDKQLKAQYLSGLLSEYEALGRRNKNVAEFAGIHNAIKKARKKIKAA